MLKKIFTQTAKSTGGSSSTSAADEVKSTPFTSTRWPAHLTASLITVGQHANSPRAQ